MDTRKFQLREQHMVTQKTPHKIRIPIKEAKRNEQQPTGSCELGADLAWTAGLPLEEAKVGCLERTGNSLIW